MTPLNQAYSTGAAQTASGIAQRAYRRRQSWMAAVLILQFAGGLGALLAPGQEIFPLYSWFLFPLTPTTPRVISALQLLEYQGHRYEPPVSLEDDRELVAAIQAPVVVRLARDLGRVVAAGDEAEVRRLRRLLEEKFLPGAGHYALVEITYDPIERLHSGAQQERVVREFAFKIREP